MRGSLFFRSYETNLPSSLTVIHSSALEYSTRPPVSVCGYGPHNLAFLGRDFIHLSDFTISFGKIPKVRLNVLFRQCVDPRTPSLLSQFMQVQEYKPVSIGCSFRIHLRTRLNLIRLTLIRNPWSFGEAGFSPALSLLMPTFSFLTLQRFLTKRLRCSCECSPTHTFY
jgi:hypothetical protein